MSRGLHTFKQGDVAKALKAARMAGLSVERYEIDKAGTITIKTGGTGESAPSADAANEWDDDK